MKIWHDDLGIQDDPHEMKVLWRFVMPRVKPQFACVSGADCAAAASGEEFLNSLSYSAWYSTVRDLMLAGF